MADSSGSESHTLELYSRLRREPWAFSFFSAIRRLENLHPDRPRVGEAALPGQEVVRLSHEPSMQFGDSTLTRFEAGEGRGRVRLVSQFLGLLGPNGALPLHLTEYTFDRLHNERDPTLARFLDIFQHRALQLFYRAWAAEQPAIQYDRPDGDAYAQWLGSLIGVAGDAFAERDALASDGRLGLASFFAHQRRDAASIEGAIARYFEVEVRLLQFAGEWLEIDPEDRSRLSEAPNCSLGATALLGERVWSAQHKFRIELGPVTLDRLRDFLPGARSLQRLVAVVRMFGCDEYDWDLIVKLKAHEVPATALGEHGRLGWTSWLGTQPRSEDVADTLVRPALEQALIIDTRKSELNEGEPAWQA